MSSKQVRPEGMSEADWAEHLAHTDPEAWQAWYLSRYREESAHRWGQR